MLDEYRRRRDAVHSWLTADPRITCVKPRGAFYIYADCGGDARAYTRELLEREAVAATPGVDFGSNRTERFVRFAYTRSLEDLEEAARRIARFASAS